MVHLFIAICPQNGHRHDNWGFFFLSIHLWEAVFTTRVTGCGSPSGTLGTCCLLLLAGFRETPQINPDSRDPVSAVMVFTAVRWAFLP